MFGNKFYCTECGSILDLIREETDDVSPDVTYHFECRGCSRKSSTFSETELNALNAHDDPEKVKQTFEKITGKK